MYSYAGWNAVTYIAGEVRNPRRTVPLSVIVAVAVVTLLYVGLNAVFLYTTPVEQLAGQIRVAAIAGQHIFGATGARIVDAVICVGLVSTISAMMWLGPRVTMAMGEDFRLLSAVRAQDQGRGAGDGHPFPARCGDSATVHAEVLSLSSSSYNLV